MAHLNEDTTPVDFPENVREGDTKQDSVGLILQYRLQYPIKLEAW